MPKTTSVFTLIAILAASSVGASLFAQYGLAMDPCPLCIAQRLTFVGIFIVSVGLRLIQALLAHSEPIVPKAFYYVPPMALLAVLLCTGLYLAGYHVWLLEQAGAATCTITIPLTLGKIQAMTPAFMDFLYEGTGFCTSPQGSPEYYQTYVLADTAFILYAGMAAMVIRQLWQCHAVRKSNKAKGRTAV